MPMSMAKAGAERVKKENRAISLRDKIRKGERETLRFVGNAEQPVMVDKKVPEKELRVETGIVVAFVFAHFSLCLFGSDCFFSRPLCIHLHLSLTAGVIISG